MSAGNLVPGRFFNKGNKYEVFFKGHHVMHQPYGTRHSSNSATPIVTDAVCHVTHDGPAEEIDEGEFYVFKPFKKNGKPPHNDRSTYIICNAADSKAPNESTMYRKVSEKESLLPGCYTWWSPSENQPGEVSPFGNRTFTAKLTDLLKCYLQSCGLSDLSEIHLRIGGTLRYDKRACKVIIVCPAKCEELSEEEYPLFDPTLNLQDMVDITLHYEELYKPPRAIKKSRFTRGRFKTTRQILPLSDFDKYAYIFYYPNDSCELKCPKDIIKTSTVKHDSRKCISKELVPIGDNSITFICPNHNPNSTRRAKKRKNDDDLADTSNSKKPAIEKEQEQDDDVNNNARDTEEVSQTDVLEPQQQQATQSPLEDTLQLVDSQVIIVDKEKENA